MQGDISLLLSQECIFKEKKKLIGDQQYQSLLTSEKRFFRRLSVFRGHLG